MVGFLRSYSVRWGFQRNSGCLPVPLSLRFRESAFGEHAFVGTHVSVRGRAFGNHYGHKHTKGFYPFGELSLCVWSFNVFSGP